MDPSIAAIVLGEMAFLGWVLRLVLGYVQDRARGRAELQARVLERFGSAAEFVDFLATEPGRRFQEALSGRRSGQARLLIGAILAGTVLVFVGVGLLVAHLKLGREPELLVGGIVTLAVGLGFLVAAPVSYGIARRWGLLAPGPAGVGDAAQA